jgi:hypothetical protein
MYSIYLTDDCAARRRAVPVLTRALVCVHIFV